MSLVKMLIVPGLAFVHWVAQFIVWAMAARDMGAHILWNILSAPMALLPASFLDSYFMTATALNSLIWGIALFYLGQRAIRAIRKSS